jgi:aldose sugar dehydrogenase
VNKKLRIAGIIAAVIVSIIIILSPSEPVPLPDPTTTAKGTDSVVVIATNLEKPRAIAFGDDRIFVTEKIGRVRVIQNNTLLSEPLATLRTANVFDGGLIGIATHPDFSNNHHLYVYYTYEEDGSLWNKILKIKESNNKLDEAETIFDKIPGSKFSNGGIIKFGPDKKLYVGTGTVSDSSHLPQELDSLAGKILRLNDDGSTPTDNPFEGSPVFSLGHRNPQGIAWDELGNLYVTDFGPTKNDEINIIYPGKNYGWPLQECSGGDFINAIICYDPSIEPGGIIIYSGDKLDLHGYMIMASLRSSHLYQLEINEDEVVSQKSILSGIGRIRDVNEGPDGNLYVITSNTDGKGFPDRFDDKLLRITK